MFVEIKYSDIFVVCFYFIYLGGTLRWNETYTIVAASASTPLKKPHGIVFDPVTKAIFIADKENSIIQKFVANNDTGETIAVNLSNIKPNAPMALAWASISGALFIAYEDKDIVVRVYPSNASCPATIIAGDGAKGSTLSELDNPSGLAVDKYEKFLYISDRENSRVLRLDLSNLTNISTIVAGQTKVNDNKNNTFNKPRGLALNNANTALFIADKDNNRIQKLMLDTGTMATVAGDPSGTDGSGSYKLKKPLDLAIDSFDNFYVADTENNRIQMFCNNSMNGTDILPNVDFKQPIGIFIDEYFNLFVSDRENNRILKFSLVP